MTQWIKPLFSKQEAWCSDPQHAYKSRVSPGSAYDPGVQEQKQGCLGKLVR